MGIASLLSAGAMAPPASAQTPPGQSASVNCTNQGCVLSVNNLAPGGGRFNILAIFLGEGGDFAFDTTVDTNADGSGLVGAATFPPGYLPQVSLVAYRDLNGNARWDPTVDDTVFQGTGRITELPQNLTISPK